MRPITEIPELQAALQLLVADNPLVQQSIKLNQTSGLVLKVAVVGKSYAYSPTLSGKVKDEYIRQVKEGGEFTGIKLDTSKLSAQYHLKLKTKYIKLLTGSINYSFDKKKDGRPKLPGTDMFYMREEVFNRLLISGEPEIVQEGHQQLIYIDIDLSANGLSLDVTKYKKPFIVDLDFFTLRSLAYALNYNQRNEDLLKNYQDDNGILANEE